MWPVLLFGALANLRSHEDEAAVVTQARQLLGDEAADTLAEALRDGTGEKHARLVKYAQAAFDESQLVSKVTKGLQTKAMGEAFFMDLAHAMPGASLSLKAAVAKRKIPIEKLQSFIEAHGDFSTWEQHEATPGGASSLLQFEQQLAMPQTPMFDFGQAVAPDDFDSAALGAGIPVETPAQLADDSDKMQSMMQRSMAEEAQGGYKSDTTLVDDDESTASMAGGLDIGMDDDTLTQENKEADDSKAIADLAIAASKDPAKAAKASLVQIEAGASADPTYLQAQVEAAAKKIKGVTLKNGIHAVTEPLSVEDWDEQILEAKREQQVDAQGLAAAERAPGMTTPGEKIDGLPDYSGELGVLSQEASDLAKKEAGGKTKVELDRDLAKVNRKLDRWLQGTPGHKQTDAEFQHKLDMEAADLK